MPDTDELPSPKELFLQAVSPPDDPSLLKPPPQGRLSDTVRLNQELMRQSIEQNNILIDQIVRIDLRLMHIEASLAKLLANQSQR